MDGVAAIKAEERAELFLATADQKGLAAPAVEKDFWVCWILKQIFEDPDMANLVLFKGGTTLSKCFGLIERFSEDIDLILDWTVLTDEDPYAARSNTQQDRFNKQIAVATDSYIGDQMLALVTRVVAAHCEVALHEERPRSIMLRYPKAFTSGYIKPEVELEFGAMSPMEPSGEFTISPYCAEVAPQLFKVTDLKVKAIEAKKTFWDKVTILHVEAHRSEDRPQPARYSRHYYDLYRMINSSVLDEAMDDLSLLKEVVAFKAKFYPQGWANYQDAAKGNFRLLPEAHIRKTLESDYAQMQEMIFGEYPAFNEILSVIGEFEQQLNGAQIS